MRMRREEKIRMKGEIVSARIKGNRQKSFRKKVLIFLTKKVRWQKSHFTKKSPEIKSYHFETWFLAPWIYSKMSPEISPIIQPCKKRGN